MPKMQLDRRGFLKVLGHVFTAYGLGAIGAYKYSIHVEPEWLSVKKVKIPMKIIGDSLDGFQFVQLSDMHFYPYTDIELIQSTVQATKDLKPDLILLTGDYVLDIAEVIFDLIPTLSQLNATYGVFAILGNHDYWTNAEIVRQGLQDAGIPVLINEGLQIGVGRESLYLAGMEDGWDGHPDIDKAFSDWGEGMPSIMMLHEPDFWDRYKDDPRLNLQISGHTHGGQVRIPFYGAPILPEFGRKYDHGLYTFKDRFLYVNRGIGVVPPPVRLNCRPEITHFTLIRE
jgi:predicted MPP superfamily phosphohydrolase